MAKIKPITLEIEKIIWDEFKDKVPDTRTLNGTIVELIQRYNYENSKKIKKKR